MDLNNIHPIAYNLWRRKMRKSMSDSKRDILFENLSAIVISDWKHLFTKHCRGSLQKSILLLRLGCWLPRTFASCPILPASAAEHDQQIQMRKHKNDQKHSKAKMEKLRLSSLKSNLHQWNATHQIKIITMKNLLQYEKFCHHTLSPRTTLLQENAFNQISFDQKFRKPDLTQKWHVVAVRNYNDHFSKPMSRFFSRKMLGTRHGLVGTRLILF